MAKPKNYVGRRFGHLVVLRRTDTKVDGSYLREVQCDCGKIFLDRMAHIQNGKNPSCGCIRKQKLIARNTSHGLSHLREYKLWKDMKGRCYRKNNKRYADYGGRGIQVCQEWRDDFMAFYRDMGECPDGLSLDRIDNDGDYCSENCRWATDLEQANNKRNNIILEFEGKALTITQWANELGIKRDTLAARYKIGWSVERMLTTPVRGK